MSKPQQASPPVPNHKCCGVVGESKSKMRKNKQRPQPWAIRKIWILFTLGIMGYSGYAYIARLCLPMIKRTQGALASQATGIVLLIFFSFLYLWMIWAYFKVVVTSPGFARDHVEKTQRPFFPDLPASSYYNSPFHQDGVPPPSETVKSDSIEEHKRSLSEKASQTNGSAHPQDGDLGAGPSYEQMLRSDSRSSKEPSAGVVDGIVQLSLSTDDKPSTPSAAGVSQQNQPTSEPVAPSRLDARRAKRLSKQAARNSRLDQLNIFRKPPSTPILQPVFRYCDSDEIVKPNRAHHCSSCGTCVLRYDHHCPWIGQCVGARNHKFFLNFCFATSIFTAYVLASSLPFIVRSLTDSHRGIEPHFIALLALAALFWIFTTALCISHVRLITHGQTTVESMQIRDIRDRDDQTLARGFAWWECRAKEKRRKTFDEEWGAVNTEGNIWWRGSLYQEWQDVMGKPWLGWIFPLGGQFGDDHGLTYPINPRFDEDGRLRKRSEWPGDLR